MEQVEACQLGFQALIVDILVTASSQAQVADNRVVQVDHTQVAASSLVGREASTQGTFAYQVAFGSLRAFIDLA